MFFKIPHDAYIFGKNCYKKINSDAALNSNVIVTGASGTGKTWSFVIPNILQMNADYVVADAKGTILKKTGKILQKNGYKVSVLNLIDLSNTTHYNPLSYIKNERDLTYLARCMINTNAVDMSSSGVSHRDPYWDNSALIVLEAMIGYLYETYPPYIHTLGNLRSMFSLLNAMSDYDSRQADEDYKSSIDFMFEEVEEKNPKSFAVEKYKEYKKVSVSGRANASILSTLSSHLSPWVTPDVISATETDEMYLDEIGQSEENRHAVFIIYDDADDSRNFLLSTLVSQLFRELFHHAFVNNSDKNPYPTRFFLDDFGSLSIPNFVDYISNARSRNIGICIMLQNESQLEEKYGKNVSTIIGNCNYYLFTHTLDLKLAEAMSIRFGRSPKEIRTKEIDRFFLDADGKTEEIERFDYTKHPDYEDDEYIVKSDIRKNDPDDDENKVSDDAESEDIEDAEVRKDTGLLKRVTPRIFSGHKNKDASDDAEDSDPEKILESFGITLDDKEEDIERKLISSGNSDKIFDYIDDEDKYVLGNEPPAPDDDEDVDDTDDDDDESGLAMTLMADEEPKTVSDSADELDKDSDFADELTDTYDDDIRLAFDLMDEAEKADDARVDALVHEKTYDIKDRCFPISLLKTEKRKSITDNKAEMNILNVLLRNFGSDHLILPQIHLESLVKDPESSIKRLNKSLALKDLCMSVDVCIADKDTCEPLIAVEVDGSQHNDDIVQAFADRYKDEILFYNDIPVYRIPANKAWNRKELEEMYMFINAFLSADADKGKAELSILLHNTGHYRAERVKVNGIRSTDFLDLIGKSRKILTQCLTPENYRYDPSLFSDRDYFLEEVHRVIAERYPEKTDD